ncbi:hypothetical protein N0V85_006496 [Neurospora sp. IMI 360204]|nr:hypothetical protein N0V85_006496 [Neurospora sp. IMI 360204]
MSSKTAPSNIITSAPYSDLTNNLTKSPTSPTARSKSQQPGNSAQRAMNNTSTWQPKLDRRQSYGQEEYKHEMQMRSGSIGSTGGSVRKAGEEGFSEEGHGY